MKRRSSKQCSLRGLDHAKLHTVPATNEFSLSAEPDVGIPILAEFLQRLSTDTVPALATIEARWNPWQQTRLAAPEHTYRHGQQFCIICLLVSSS